ncbi:MAG TPA: hypothetical protein VIE36_11070 [Methylomirabilota bacterium]|jgi:hypothetical protein
MTVRDVLRSIPGTVPVVRYLRTVGRPAPPHRYWEKRKHFRYYAEVLRLARRYGPDARSVLDVGSMHSPFILQFDWIAEKTSLDVRPGARLRGCTCLQGDFLTYDVPGPFDLVVCLQVLEHLEAPTPFVQKLLDTGATVIVSVPYRWPHGKSPNHVQDPVDEAKLRRWAGRDWVEQQVVRESDGTERLVVVFRSAATPR